MDAFADGMLAMIIIEFTVIAIALFLGNKK